MSSADLRLVLLLVLLVFTSAIFAACRDAPVAPDSSLPSFAATPPGGGKVKVEVCHRNPDGSYNLIKIGEPGLDAHLAHGDAVPGDPVPDMSGHVFDDTCAAVPFDPVWEGLAAMPIPVRAAAAETDGSKVFVFFGAYNVNDERNVVQIYDPATNAWSLGTPLNPVRAFNMAATLPDGIHVVGGFNTAHLNNHDVYDPATDTWSTRAPLPRAVHAGTAEIVAGKLYVMTPDQGCCSVMQIYDPATDSWSMGTPRPVAGGTFASAVIDGLIYVAGGQAAGGTITRDVLHSYNPTTDSWQQLASMPGERSALGGGAIGGQFCVFGGRTAQAFPTGARFDETLCYDPATDTWSNGPDMIIERAEMATAELDNAIYALGGRPSNDALHSSIVEKISY